MKHRLNSTINIFSITSYRSLAYIFPFFLRYTLLSWSIHFSLLTISRCVLSISFFVCLLIFLLMLHNRNRNGKLHYNNVFKITSKRKFAYFDGIYLTLFSKFSIPKLHLRRQASALFICLNLFAIFSMNYISNKQLLNLQPPFFLNLMINNTSIHRNIRLYWCKILKYLCMEFGNLWIAFIINIKCKEDNCSFNIKIKEYDTYWYCFTIKNPR